MMANVLIC